MSKKINKKGDAISAFLLVFAFATSLIVRGVVKDDIDLPGSKMGEVNQQVEKSLGLPYNDGREWYKKI